MYTRDMYNPTKVYKHIGMPHTEDILANIYCSYNAYLRRLAYSYKSSRSFLNANAEHGAANTGGKLSITKLSNR